MARLQVVLDHVVEKLVVHLALHVQDEEEAKLVLSSAPDPSFMAKDVGRRVVTFRGYISRVSLGHPYPRFRIQAFKCLAISFQQI